LLPSLLQINTANGSADKHTLTSSLSRSASCCAFAASAAPTGDSIRLAVNAAVASCCGNRCRTLLLPVLLPGLLTLLHVHTTELRRVTADEVFWRVASAFRAMVAVVVCRKLLLLGCDLHLVETARQQQGPESRESSER
jgi:hypothetical protein